MLQADPGEKRATEDDIEEALVRDREYDKDWGEGEEDDDESV